MERYQTAYFYDIWDLEKKQYLPQEQVEAIVHQMGLNYVPVLYKGEFESCEQIKALVGKTTLGGLLGEGIMTALNDPEAKYPAYLKIVGEKFKETKVVKRLAKQLDSEEVERKEKLRAVMDFVVTEARVRKLVHKMVDKGILPENWG